MASSQLQCATAHVGLKYLHCKPKQKCIFNQRSPLGFVSVNCTQESLLLRRVNLRALALNEHNMREPPLHFHIKVAFFFFFPFLIWCKHTDSSIPLLSCSLPRVWWSARCHRTPPLRPPRTRSPGTTRPRGAPPRPARASSSGCRRTPYGLSAPRPGPPLPGSSGAHPWPGTRGSLGQQRGCSDQILPSNQPCSAFPSLRYDAQLRDDG